MSMTKRKVIMVGLLALCAAGLAVTFLWQGGDESAADRQEQRRNVKNSRKAARKAGRNMRRAPEKKGKEKPTFNLKDEEYAGLSAEIRAIVTALQEAVDNDDNKGISRVCAKILKIIQEKGEDAVPVVVRENAVDALGLALPGSLPELMGFMADGDDDVREAVNDELEDLFGDPAIGDNNLSPMVASIAKVATDEDILDSLVMAVESDMRNSVMVATYKTILDTGTPEAKEQIRESITELLEDEDVKPATDNEQLKKQLDEWLKGNPDDDDDDEMYGADPNADSDSDPD